MDVRDKLLFEPEYAGNIKEKIPPKSSLRIPRAWLPAALCLLQEVQPHLCSILLGLILGLVFSFQRFRISQINTFKHSFKRVSFLKISHCSVPRTHFGTLL